ncbi:MAG: ATP-binding protein [Rhodospirillales bacterium]|nr:ATP-binding protein [Rhodospirillales bacterium]
MIPLFTKPLNDLSASDVKHLCNEALPEGQTVEFKETLPSKDAGGDRWLKDGQQIGERARDKILEEVVAFANADGGSLVIGIEETTDHPKRASKIKPLPKCHELAHRLSQAARDCIDPQLPAIEICGITTMSRKQAGVVLIRVPPSRLAPHRLTTTRECYIRRADRTETMTMREIQDRTIKSARMFETVTTRLESRRAKQNEFLRLGNQFGLIRLSSRVTILPARSSVAVDRIYASQDLFPHIVELNARVDGLQVRLLPPPRVLTINDLVPVPILRGSYRRILVTVGVRRRLEAVA